MNHCSLDNDRCPLSTEPAVVGDFQPFPFSGEFESLELDWSPLNRSIEDHRNFYSPHSLLWLTGGLAVGGLMANTSGDEVIQRHFQASVLGASSDSWYEWFHASKELGNGYYTLPIMAGAYLTSELLPETTGAQRLRLWSERSVRGTLVGAPPLIGLQLLTGGSRPNETDRGSRWSPFDDNNGISGHSFMGALPFITAAKVSENRLEKAGWYAASFMAPLSRVNDDAHYPSQVALGWWMAYLAASAVATTDAQESIWVIVPYADANGTGVVGATRF
ncbi:MAG: phosphatase PAP2 family protein [Planctomycetales bacterium]|nr:phosphatase PAP2 family protein [Planctomycetales bacterium]